MKPQLVVAKFNEDISWLLEVSDIPALIYDKSTTGNVPNVGREANSYLRYIVENYDVIEWETIFCQGHPFDHDPDFLAHVRDESVRWYGRIERCNAIGQPHYELGLMDHFCAIFGMPQRQVYPFVAGAQYRVTAEQIRARPLAFYKALLHITELDVYHAYSLERLWPICWGIELP